MLVASLTQGKPDKILIYTYVYVSDDHYYVNGIIVKQGDFQVFELHGTFVLVYG